MPIYYENPNISEHIKEHPIEVFIPSSPWVRYFARMIDMYFGSMLIAITWVRLSPNTYNKILGDNSNEYVAGVILCIIWLLIESMMISTLGTTFGKWIFSSKVISIDGGRLKFSKALLRSFSMCFNGLGLMIPVVSLFTLSNSFKQIKNQNYGGFTKWDIQTKSAVITTRLKPIKVALLLTFCIVSLAGYNYHYDNQSKIMNENNEAVEQLDEIWTKLDDEGTLLTNWENELANKYKSIAELAQKLEYWGSSGNETEYNNNIDNYNRTVNDYNVEESLYETRRLKYVSDTDSYNKKYDELMGTTE
ncbi:RDD family protein [Clostridium estertheticum]|uniref:RDD family protein n=1 Tax=Clostridium estertheticum TaxID=238834 RepID=UPI0013E97D9F|nr:RDD family protein [Clostridium estertheticum]MBZ9689813.1 RDD family protein [Clostridium estertheticum]